MDQFLTAIKPIIEDGNIWPDEEDLTGVIISLCRIKLTWDMNPREFSEGRVVKLESKAKLSINDLTIIAEDRVRGKDLIKINNGPEWAIAIEFLEVAYQ